MSSFTEGYKACIHDISDFLNHSIKAHGGCKTPQQAVDVLNSVIYHLHHLKFSSAPSVMEEPAVDIDTQMVDEVMEEINRELRHLFDAPFKITVIKGGKN